LPGKKDRAIKKLSSKMAQNLFKVLLFSII
jgi:hypothetical protein